MNKTQRRLILQAYRLHVRRGLSGECSDYFHVQEDFFRAIGCSDDNLQEEMLGEYEYIINQNSEYEHNRRRAR